MTRVQTRPPAHLEPPEADLFRRIASEYGINDSAGLALLTAACEARGRQRRCRERIDVDGELSLDGKPHPLLVTERDARKAFVATLNSMGLDTEPAAAVGRPTTTVRRIK